MVWTVSGRARRAVSAAAAARKDGCLHSLQQAGSARFQLGEAKARSLPRRTDMVQEQEGTVDLLQLNKEPERKPDLLYELRQRFLGFKRQKYLKEIDKFRELAKAQAPKVMVIGCADSRVCPSYILGFQPGEAFMIRNVANLIPPLQNGPTETNSALEFAVNTLQVENIIVMGHSNCGGIAALMSMQKDEQQSSLVERWVINGNSAKLRTLAGAYHLSFDQQCKYCEKESIKDSMMNLLTYPWIRERLRRRVLSIHGGYYDLSDCSFKNWKLCSYGNDNDKWFVLDGDLWS